ncbi:tetratricopeptide repeat protein [Sphaerisporangium sp. NBC_01403]|uniref:AfsR/SARP family transcriptional regulator n=1 Tax=Sphaerisporangium sp. NBC_01403 TaxID=2903599 RepID=UPI0032470726
MVTTTFGVLGPVYVRGADGREIHLRGKQYAVLAVLLLNVNTWVSRERLIDALWETPPASAVSNLHTHITQIRKALSGDTRLSTKRSGYLLEAGPEEVDLLTFDQEVRRARAEVKQGDVGAAVRRFERTLLLWRGRPVEGIQLSSSMLARVSELEERLTDARLDCSEAKLRIGRYGEAIGELRLFLAENPLCERAWQLLMLAFASDGQRDKALQAYWQARARLVDELGIEPGRELRRLQAVILTDDLAATDPERRGPICQLPPDHADFVGRSEELSAVTKELLSTRRQEASTGATVPVGAISGQGGVGKTVLAVHIAHQIRHAFPDGQLYIDLRGGEKHPVHPAEALGRFLRALGMDSSTVPAELDQRAELYRSKLADQRYLVVLDNALDEAQVSPLTPSTPGCAVLITSRHRLTALPAAQLIDLDVLSVDEAVEMLEHIIGPQKAAESPDHARELVQLCGRLPLAVRIAGAKLAARPYWSLSDLVSCLSDTRSRLSRLSHGSREVRASIAVGYQGLSSQAQRMFGRLGLLEAPDFAIWAGAALLDVPEPEAENLIEQLVDVRLLDIAGRGPDGRVRFRFHDLTRMYARERAEDEEGDAERTTALERALSGWLVMARHAHARLCGGDYRVVHGDGGSWQPDLQVADRIVGDPLAWIDAERAGVVAAVRQCASLGFDELCWELASSAMHLFETRSFYDEWRMTHETALSCARDAGNLRGEAAVLNGLAGLFLAQDENLRGGEVLEDSLRLFAKVGDRYGHALALVNMAELHRVEGRYPAALACYDEAAGGLAEAGDRGSEIAVLRGIGQIHFNQGRHAAARPYIERAVEQAGSVGDVRAREFARILLGEIQLAQDEPAAAEQSFAQALTFFADLGFPRGTAYASLGLASAKLALRLFEDAEHLLGEALATYRSVDERLGEARVLFVWAELHRSRRRFDEAATVLETVVAICQGIPAPRRQGLALRALGDVRREAGDLEAAVGAWQKASTALETISPSECEEIAVLLELHANQVH